MAPETINPTLHFIGHQQPIHFKMLFIEHFVLVKILKTCIAIHLYLKVACMKSKKPFVKYWPDFNAYFGLKSEIGWS